MASYYWADSAIRSAVPPAAVVGGRDSDGTNIYVGRAHHEGDWVPAKVIPQKNACYISYNGQEILKHSYQLLCQQQFEWVPSHNGMVPPGAIEGGRTRTGEVLYIGRVHHQGALTIGKVHPSHRNCYIPFGGREIPFNSYEVMVMRS